MENNSSDHHFALTVNISIEALKALLIVNGGAATALIALSSKSPDGLNFGVAVLLFGLAALLNSVTLVTGYFSQLAYANHRLAFEQQDMAEATKCIKQHDCWQLVAVGIVMVSLIVSAAAMFCAFRAL